MFLIHLILSKTDVSDAANLFYKVVYICVCVNIYEVNF